MSFRLSKDHLTILYEVSDIGIITQTEPIIVFQLRHYIWLLIWEEVQKFAFNRPFKLENLLCTWHDNHHLFEILGASVRFPEGHRDLHFLGDHHHVWIIVTHHHRIILILVRYRASN